MNAANVLLSRRSWPGWMVTLVNLVIAAVVLASIAAVANRLIAAYDVAAACCTASFALAAMVAVLYRIANPYGWTLILQALTYRTSFAGSLRIWLLAESRRWLPGGVWGYASRAVQARELGVPLSVASGSMLVELLVTMAAAVVVAILGLLFHYERLSATFCSLWTQRVADHALILAAAILMPAVAGLTYVARRKLDKKLLELCQRFQLLRGVKLQWRPLLAALAYLMLMAALNGCVNLSLLPAVDPSASVPGLVMIAATSAAWIVGFLAFFSPAGILVREASLATLLLPWLSYEAGMTLAVLSRIAQLLAEIACMLPACWLEHKKQLRMRTGRIPGANGPHALTFVSKLDVC